MTFFLHRISAHRLMVIGTATVVLLVVVMASVGPIWVKTVGDASVRQRIVHSPAIVGVEVRLDVPAAEFAAMASRAERLLDEDAGDFVGAARTLAIGPSLRHEGWEEGVSLPLVAVGGLTGTVEVAAGAGPEDATASPSVAVHEAVAERLDIHIGDELDLSGVGGVDGGRVEVTGFYRSTDPDAERWWDQLQMSQGLAETQDGPLFAPLLTSVAGLEGLVEAPIELRVFAPTEPTVISADDVPEVISAIASLDSDAAERFEPHGAEVVSLLPELLTSATQDARTARGPVLLAVVLLVAVALVALTLVANVLQQTRRGETWLLQGRGETRGQRVATAMWEAALLITPAVLIGPWIATVLAWYASGGVGLTAGLTDRPAVSLTSVVAAALAGVVCVAALVGPTVATSLGDRRRAGSGARGRFWVQRFGIDLGLLALAAMGLWQVRRSAGGATGGGARTSGAASVDPVLVVAPAVGLAAGVLLLLRAVPWLGGWVSRVPATMQGLVGGLGVWQLARRPAHVAWVVAATSLAVAVVTFAGSYAATWERAQHDRAVATVPADVVVRPNERPGAAVPGHLAGGGWQALPGVEARGGVAEATGPLPRGRGVARVLAVDTSSEVVGLRSDMWPGTDAWASLAAFEPLDGVALPSGRQLSAEIVAGSGDTATEASTTLMVAFEIVDGDGLVHRLPVEAGMDGDRHHVTIDLETVVGGRTLAVTDPVQLVAVELAVPTRLTGSGGPADSLEVTVHGLELDGSPVLLGGRTWEARPPTLQRAVMPPRVQPPQVTGSDLAIEVDPGTADTSGRARFRLETDIGDPATPLPAVATPSLLAATQAQVGEVVQVQAFGTSLPVEIAGEIGHLPGSATGDPGLLIDLARLADHRYRQDRSRITPDAWWLAVDDDQHDAVAAAARTQPFHAVEVTARTDEAAELRSDPAAAGGIGMLTIGSVLAALAAVVGYLVAEGAAIGRRTGEVAALRALGSDGRSIRRWLHVEAATLTAAAVVYGALLGMGMAWLVAPAVTVGDDSTPMPPPVLVVPGVRMLAVAATATVIALLLPIIASRRLERKTISSRLRAGTTSW